MRTETIRGSDHQRSIVMAVKKQLRSSSYYALRHLSCELEDNVLTLCGKVPSYYEKQLAQNLVLQQLTDEVILENRLEVAQSSGASRRVKK